MRAFCNTRSDFHLEKTDLRECKYTVKEKKITSFIEADLKLDGSDGSDSE